MAIADVVIDDTMDKNVDIKNPTWEDVEAAIIKMDGKRYSSVGMLLGNEDNMIVGGGADKYVVGVRLGDGLYNLMNRWGVEDREVEVVAGEKNDFPENEIISQQDALTAAKYFFHNHSLDTTYTWKS